MVESRADEVPATRGGGGGEGKEKESAGDALGGEGDEEEGEGERGGVVEKDGKERGMSGVEGEGEGEGKSSGVRTVDATAHTDEAQDLPGGRTQEQEAGEGGRGRVEESVAD